MSAADGAASETTPVKRPRHLIHEPTLTVDLSDQITLTETQIIPSSQPWMIRGPIWKKPQSPELQVEEASNSRAGPSEDQMPMSPFDSDDWDHPESPGPGQKTKSPTKGGVVGLATVNASCQDFDFIQELAGLPSDAFLSSPSPLQEEQPDEESHVSSKQAAAKPHQQLCAPVNGLHQTTLFGRTGAAPPFSQANKRHAWPLVSKNEPPTHHKLDPDAVKTWVYPTNLGKIRDYQYNIVARGLFHNLLVALPTGLGKTFIAATIMLNWYRWTKDAQIVFVAPTKPLVAQQVDACFHIAGIPWSDTTMLTGEISAGIRAEEWEKKRVFFMTPQTLINDLKKGSADPKKIVLLVVDEAHRATGGYAYVEVVKFIKRFNESFRVLALTATPGGDIEAVQKVIDGLDIARVEIRTEQSLDIRDYVHHRQVEKLVFQNSEEMIMLMDLYSKAVQPVLNIVIGKTSYWQKDPVALTPYGCTKALTQWMNSDAARRANPGLKGMVRSVFANLASLSHNMELLKYHGITPFYNGLLNFQRETETRSKSTYRKQIIDSEDFKKMMCRLKTWTANSDFLGHPKLEALRRVILNHLLDAGEGTSASTIQPMECQTRIMVFAHFRDSAEDIARILMKDSPMIRPHVFVGQASAKNSEGMTQKKQLAVIQDFKAGTINTLIATSIGEEGLDIGEVDLIVCYDSKSSPLRMLQRMGRTGRKRAGKVVLFQMEGKEEDDAATAKDAYEKMQGLIASGDRFTFHEERSRRILPREIQPVADKREIVIPYENTQHRPDSLPIPSKKGRGRGVKRPTKKFHMPDGVRTGFTTATSLDDDENDQDSLGHPRKKAKLQKSLDEAVIVPALNDVLLNELHDNDLDRRFKHADYEGDEGANIERPNLSRHSSRQRVLCTAIHVDHGRASTRFVDLMKRMNAIDDCSTAERNHAFNQEWLQPEDAADTLVDDICQPLSKENDQRQKISPARRYLRTPRTLASGRKSATKLNRVDNALTDVLEAEPSSPDGTSPVMRLAHSQAITLGSADTPPASDQEANDMNDDDSDLADFIVDDGEEIAEEPSSLPSIIIDRTPKGTQSSSMSTRSEDLPDLGQLLGAKTTNKRLTKQAMGSAKNAVLRKRGRVIVCSDDNDDS